MRNGQLTFLAVVLAAGTLGNAPAQAADKVDFAREIRPILSEHCFACHGPDQEARKAKLRLDTREGAIASRNGEAAIVPGSIATSILVARITSTDEDELMPPKKSGKVLTSTQIDLLKRWIEQGASWGEHWSFVAPRRPALPHVKDDQQWVRNPIDRFILARLESAGLAPAPEADRRTLARRAALDLTGLPPNPADVEAFVADPSPDAYEKYIEKHLAMPEWGEHRARYWLDAARYADTHGLHHDNYREMWPFRQWVINAFNANMPFDRFTIEQVAGDLLPDRTLDQQIASGFHRNNITTSEGGSINEEVLAIYAKDRVETTGTVFLGLTAGCAACHDHKFDPVTQKEFYQLAAFFRNTTQVAMDGNIPDTPPVMVVPSQDDAARWVKVQEDLRALRDRKNQRLAALKPDFEQWLETCDEALYLDAPVESKHELLAAMISEHDETGAAVACGGVTSAIPKGVEIRNGPSESSKGIFFTADASLAFPTTRQIDADGPFTMSVWVWIDRPNSSGVIASRFDGKSSEKMHGWKLEAANGSPVLTLIGDSPTDAISMDLYKPRLIPEKKWTHLAITYDGSRTSAGFLCYVNGRLIPADRSRNPANGQGVPPTVLKGSIQNSIELRLGGDGAGNFRGNGLADFRIFQRELIDEEIDAMARWDQIRRAVESRDKKSLDPVRGPLAALYAARIDAGFSGAVHELAKTHSQARSIAARSPVTHVMNERGDAKPSANVLFRGMYDQPRESVQAGVPAALHPLPGDAPPNRLGLARWIVAPENPLTARVTVNRFWQEVFGTGLVRTAEDFGNTGEAPTHPELLDYLAIEFRESGWDVKKMYRLMLTSATYRQAALLTPKKLEKDPLNRLLSRGPRFRMDGEMVRDSALASSGLLVRKLGGPSVRAYQPDGVWEAVAMLASNTRFYKRDAGEALYRRSIYWFWKRSAPPASMEIFNAPSREVCTVRRERGNTPIQALVTMNDVQFVEAARHLAQRALLAEIEPDARLDFITAAVLSRAFEADERRTALASLARFWSRFQRDPEAAGKLVAYGESKADEKLNTSELAAWTLLASQIMNLDEALNK